MRVIPIASTLDLAPRVPLPALPYLLIAKNPMELLWVWPAERGIGSPPGPDPSPLTLEWAPSCLLRVSISLPHSLWLPRGPQDRSPALAKWPQALTSPRPHPAEQRTAGAWSRVHVLSVFV